MVRGIEPELECQAYAHDGSRSTITVQRRFEY